MHKITKTVKQEVLICDNCGCEIGDHQISEVSLTTGKLSGKCLKCQNCSGIK